MLWTPGDTTYIIFYVYPLYDQLINLAFNKKLHEASYMSWKYYVPKNVLAHFGKLKENQKMHKTKNHSPSYNANTFTFFSVFFLHICTTTIPTMCAISFDLSLIWLKNWLATSKSNMLIFLGGKKKKKALPNWVNHLTLNEHIPPA